MLFCDSENRDVTVQVSLDLIPVYILFLALELWCWSRNIRRATFPLRKCVHHLQMTAQMTHRVYCNRCSCTWVMLVTLWPSVHRWGRLVKMSFRMHYRCCECMMFLSRLSHAWFELTSLGGRISRPCNGSRKRWLQVTFTHRLFKSFRQCL